MLNKAPREAVAVETRHRCSCRVEVNNYGVKGKKGFLRVCVHGYLPLLRPPYNPTDRAISKDMDTFE